MQIDENLLSQVSDFLKTSEGAEIVEGLKKSLTSENSSDLGSLSSLFFLLIHACISRLGGGQNLVFTCPVPIPMAELELSLREPHGSQN